MKVYQLLIICISFVFISADSILDYPPPYEQFKEVITNEKYHCWGVPCEKYRTYTCSICKSEYVLQNFCKYGKMTTTMYYSSAVCSNNNEYHDNKSGNLLEPCGCDDDINIDD